MFAPFDHPGIPLDRQTRHWHELDVAPVDAASAESAGPAAEAVYDKVRDTVRSAAR